MGRAGGYALVMPVECRSFIPILEPMFERLARWDCSSSVSTSWADLRGKAVAGKGVFDLLYRAHRDHLRETWDACVTEVATATPSMRAHERVGFQVIDRYRDATDEWLCCVEL